MKAFIISIGNSRGLRIPKALLEQVGMTDEVDLSVHNNQIVIQASSPARQGWEEAFRRANDGVEEIVLGDLMNEWDETEWQW